jgi:hypothetical protein
MASEVATCRHLGLRYSSSLELQCPACGARWIKCRAVVRGRDEYLPAPAAPTSGE